MGGVTRLVGSNPTPSAVYVDPALFDPEAIDEETMLFNIELERLLATMPDITKQTPEEVRHLRDAGLSVFGEYIFSDLATERTIPGPGGDIKLRMLVPPTSEGVFLHLHGGGWVVGGIDHQDPQLEALMLACGVAVVSAQYRLAPENPHPAGNDDCEAAAVWLVDNALAEFGTDRLVVGGESAGAHLAVSTLLRMRDRHDYTGFLGANLVYGPFDLSGTPSVRNWGDRSLVLSTPIMEWFWNHYIGDNDPYEPDISPLYADLTDMPPALFTVGTLDPLIDDSLFMATRWLEHGSEARLAVYPGGVHAFDAFPTPLAQQARATMYEFINDVLLPAS